jgi:hypothetical protein
MTEFKIERGIPYPVHKKSPAGRKPVYPIDKLEVGQSFLVPSKATNISDLRSLTAAIFRARHTHDLNIQWNKEKGGFRVHRGPGGYVKNAKA